MPSYTMPSYTVKIPQDGTRYAVTYKGIPIRNLPDHFDEVWCTDDTNGRLPDLMTFSYQGKLVLQAVTISLEGSNDQNQTAPKLTLSYRQK